MFHYDISRLSTDWHTIQELRGHTTGRWFDRFLPCRYKFEYALKQPLPFHGLDLVFEEISMNERNLLDWFDLEIKGHVKLVISFVRHDAMSALARQINRPEQYHWLLVKVYFSHKSLASLWKLSWGGKVVDRLKVGRKHKV